MTDKSKLVNISIGWITYSLFQGIDGYKSLHWWSMQLIGLIAFVLVFAIIFRIAKIINDRKQIKKTSSK